MEREGLKTEARGDEKHSVSTFPFHPFSAQVRPSFRYFHPAPHDFRTLWDPSSRRGISMFFFPASLVAAITSWAHGFRFLLRYWMGNRVVKKAGRWWEEKNVFLCVGGFCFLRVYTCVSVVVFEQGLSWFSGLCLASFELAMRKSIIIHSFTRLLLSTHPLIHTPSPLTRVS